MFETVKQFYIQKHIAVLRNIPMYFKCAYSDILFLVPGLHAMEDRTRTALGLLVNLNKFVFTCIQVSR